MSFTNLTPDRNPNGTLLSSPGLSSGTRFFYFTFISQSNSLDVFLSRNIYRNEEYITQIYDNNNTQMLIAQNLSNILPPTTFDSGRIGLSTPAGVRYANITNTPNFKINNLIIGRVYTLESRTLYNDVGTDFGVILRNGTAIVPLTYVRTSPQSIPLPPPPPPPSSQIPPIPFGFSVTNATAGTLLSWSESMGATSYKIYRDGFVIGTSTSSSFIDSFVVSSAKYEYTVTAANSFGESPKSASVQIVTSFSFVNLVPDKTPLGESIVGYGVRYFYYLFTPITSAVDVFLCNNGITSEEAIIGLYDTTDSSNINLFTTGANITNLDSNVQYSILGLGTIPNPTLSVVGLQITASGVYRNSGTKANFRINNLAGDLTTPDANIKSYILEIVTVNNQTDAINPDLGAYIKNVGSGVHASHGSQLVYNSSSPSRNVPTPYVIAYNFQTTSLDNYTKYIYPNLRVFQNCKNILENVISSTPVARAPRRNNDMLINFVVEALESGVVGQSSLTGWKVDSSRSPDFTYEQNISFSSAYFANGYLIGPSQFNGSSNVNGGANISLFNVLIHEIMHGIGILYANSYNTTSNNIGWSPYIINAPNDPWYKGPTSGASSAVEGYRAYSGISTLQYIPIENSYGPGTALSHWDEGVSPNNAAKYRYFNGQYHPAFKFEIMTGFTNSNDYMTRMTAGALKDYGYAVNLNSPYVVRYPSNQIPSPQMMRERAWTLERPAVRCTCIMEDGVCRHVLKMENEMLNPYVAKFAHTHAYKTHQQGVTFINRNGIPYANQLQQSNYMCSTMDPML